MGTGCVGILKCVGGMVWNFGVEDGVCIAPSWLMEGNLYSTALLVVGNSVGVP